MISMTLLTEGGSWVKPEFLEILDIMLGVVADETGEWRA
jgi:hypothetical protein